MTLYSPNRKIAAHCLLLACSLLITCGKRAEQTTATAGKEKKWNQSEAEEEFRLIKTELTLAESEKPYLALDFRKRQLILKLRGVVVWNYKLEIDQADAAELKDFADRFQGKEKKLVRPLMAKYLFASESKTPDSILAIVSRVTNVQADLMQREIPSRFQLFWSDDLVLDIRTEVVGKPKSKFQNTLVEIRQAMQRPFGSSLIVVRIPKDIALTLYRATEPGIPTIVYRPS